MSSRLDGAVENIAVSTINGLDSDIATFRTRQSIPRSLVRRAFLAQSASAFDVNGYSVAANTVHFFYILFTGNGTQTYPYGVQFSAVYNNGTSSAQRLSDYGTLDSSGTGYSWTVDGTNFGPNKIGWVIAVTAGSSGATVYIKGRTMTTCGGSWTMSW